MASQERTEKPTAKRLQDARKRGQVARSRDVAQVAVLAAALFALKRWGGPIIARLESEIAWAMAMAGDAALRPLDAGDLRVLVVRGGFLVAAAVGPIALASVAAAVGASVLQTGWVVSAESLTLDWTRLSPARGLQRIVKVGGYDLLKMFVLVGSLGFVATAVTRSVIHDTARLARLSTPAAATGAWTVTEQLFTQSLLILAVIAAADYGFQRYRHMAGLRMTKQEVQDEERQREGNPLIKGRVRRVQREMVRRRMLAATKRATVVITNPTHYAVALEYRRESMSAPRVVAKGRELLAQRIKDIAREAGVPIVEQVTLARALYKSVEVGEVIPADLFEAVAEILAYLVRLKQLVL